VSPKQLLVSKKDKLTTNGTLLKLKDSFRFGRKVLIVIEKESENETPLWV
jgi:hypothetical protein